MRKESKTFLHRIRFDTGEENPAAIFVPPRIVHAYKCISQEKGLVINLPDKLYRGIQRQLSVDEIRHEENTESDFVLD